MSSLVLRGAAFAVALGLCFAGCGSSSGLVLSAAPDSLILDEDQTASIAVSLASEPKADVVVTTSFASSDVRFLVESGATLTFSRSAWRAPQLVSIRCLPDADSTPDTATLLFVADAKVVKDVRLTQREPVPAPPPIPPIDPGEPKDGVPLTVKDAAGVGAVDWPVTAVIPLSYGVYQDTSNFRIVDGRGDPVPAQFEVLNRWWARDNSIRHVVAHFRASVSADSRAYYTFQTTGAGPAPAQPVVVTESAGAATVDTGPLKFTVKQNGFNLFDEVWIDANGDGEYAENERIVASNAQNGPVFTGRLPTDVQRASTRSSVRMEIEERGPMRAVIRVSAPTVYNGSTDHTHGFAVRIYAYAGSTSVKVDYQLQNSAKDVRYSAPLYFDDLSLLLRPAVSDPTLRIATGPGNVWSGAVSTGRYLFQSSLTASSVRSASDGAVLFSGTNAAGEASCGWLDLSDAAGGRGVFVTIRNMAEMWPSGIEVDAGGTVYVRLWPKWSAQFHENRLNVTGLYWLEDMQHVVKEVLFHFHAQDTSTGELERIARNFQYHPVPFVPVAEYARTRVTFDLDGIVPIANPVAGTDTRRLVIGPDHVKAKLTDPTNAEYAFGWMNYFGDTGRKIASIAGGWPDSSGRVVATERVDEWLTAEAKVWGELNVRGEWMAGYTFAEDFARVEPTTDPYDGRSWRAYVTGTEADLPLDAPHIAGTGFGGWRPRDNAHGWFYYIEEFYYLSGNPWIRDWYEFIGEFRKGERSDPKYPGWSSLNRDGFEVTRAEAHGIAHSMAAFRVTGDGAILDRVRDRLRYSLATHQRPDYGAVVASNYQGAEGSVFEHGYLGRTLAQIMTEVDGYDDDLYARAFQLLWGVVDFNHYRAYFTYRYSFADALANPPSAGSSVVMVDPQALFVLRTKLTKYLTTLNGYIDTGLNGGSRPYGDLSAWTGDYLGRAAIQVRGLPPTPTAPAAISNLTATATAGGVNLSWTAPAGAARYHVVWSALPIAADVTLDASKRNPWACSVATGAPQPLPGAQQSMTVSGLPSGQRIYFAVFTFGQDGSMSTISNVPSAFAP